MIVLYLYIHVGPRKKFITKTNVRCVQIREENGLREITSSCLKNVSNVFGSSALLPRMCLVPLPREGVRGMEFRLAGLKRYVYIV